MCLLVVLSRTYPEAPLVVAANRDERLDRPAVPMTLLATESPRVLGGRDEVAGGTWLAVNDAGVVAGLTNRPVEGGPDPAKRSRGELPLTLALHPTAAEAVAAFEAQVDPSAYNPAWLLVGDRHTLFSIDISDQRSMQVRELPPGLHVLENNGFEAASPKVGHVRMLLSDLAPVPDESLQRQLVAVMSDHELPAGGPSEDGAAPAAVRRSAMAACVHGEWYGTRWSAVISVPAAPDEPPSFVYADGPPCTAPFVDGAALWTADTPPVSGS